MYVYTDGPGTFLDRVRTLLEVIALVIGGWWWWHRKEGLPRAKLSIDVEHVLLEDQTHFLRVITGVESIGHVRLRVEKATVQLRRIRPIRPNGVPSSITDVSMDGKNREIDWPALVPEKLFTFTGTDRNEFEPSEQGLLIFDFTVPD